MFSSSQSLCNRHSDTITTVIPAFAGIYACHLHYRNRELRRWIPAFAGMTVNMTTPAFAGMTVNMTTPVCAGMTVNMTTPAFAGMTVKMTTPVCAGMTVNITPGFRNVLARIKHPRTL